MVKYSVTLLIHFEGLIRSPTDTPNPLVYQFDVNTEVPGNRRGPVKVENSSDLAR